MGVGRADLWGGGVQAADNSSRGWVWEGCKIFHIFLEGGGSGKPGNPSDYTLAPCLQ